MAKFTVRANFDGMVIIDDLDELEPGSLRDRLGDFSYDSITIEVEDNGYWLGSHWMIEGQCVTFKEQTDGTN